MYFGGDIGSLLRTPLVGEATHKNDLIITPTYVLANV